jgi:hypothetical protein
MLTQRRTHIVRRAGHDRSRQIDIKRAVLPIELERYARCLLLFARRGIGGREQQQRDHSNCNCSGKTSATTSERERPRDDPS